MDDELKTQMTNGGLDKLLEECGEVVQVIGKYHGAGVGTLDVEYWDGTHLGQRLEEEIADVLAAITFVTEKHKLNTTAIYRRKQRKLARFRKWDRGEWSA